MDENQPNSEPRNADDVDPALDHDPDDLTGELVAYLDGELDRDGSEAVGAKISLDVTVRSEADALKKTWDLLDYLPRPEPSPNFTERTMSRIEPLNRSGATGATSGSSAVKSGGSAALSARSSSGTGPLMPPPSLGQRATTWMTWVAVIAVAGVAGWFIRELLVDRFERMDQDEMDAKILSERRLLEGLKSYRYVDDIELLQAFDNPDLFGDEHAVPLSEGPR